VLVESPAAASICINADNIGYLELLQPAGHPMLTWPVYDFLNWLIMDMMPAPVQRVVGFRQPNRLVRQYYRSLAWTMVNTLHFMGGEIREIEQARQRVPDPAQPRSPEVERTAL
jgi:hypothetical protein